MVHQWLLALLLLLLRVLSAQRRGQRGWKAGHSLAVPGRRRRYSSGVLKRAVVLLLERADLCELQRVRRSRLSCGCVLRLLQLLQVLQVLQLVRMDLLLMLLLRLLLLLSTTVQLLLSHGHLSCGLLIAESHPWDEKWLLNVHVSV